MGEERKQHAIAGALEAFLFLYGEPVPYARVAKALKVEEAEARAAADELEQAFVQAGRGLCLLREGETVQLVTKADSAHLMESLLKEELREELTPAALETLTIVAYAGPLSRGEIEYVRGVNSSFILRALFLRGLITRMADPSRGIGYFYRPSADFLRYIGIAKIELLPQYAEVRAAIERFRNASAPKSENERPSEQVNAAPS